MALLKTYIYMVDMNNPLSRLSRHLKRMYACFWLSAILLVGVGECLDDWSGCYASHAVGVYVGESIVILLTALCVPLALKLWVWWKRRYIDSLPLMQAMAACSRGYAWRLWLLVLPLWGGLLLYYLTWSAKGTLCAAIALTASLFCWPGEARLRRELDIDGDEASSEGGDR